MQDDTVLSFEEFTHRKTVQLGRVSHPTYNNFIAYFIDAELYNETYQRQVHFLRFKDEYPELERRLREGLSRLNREHRVSFEELRQFDTDLYEAYRTMREFGATNHMLFA